MDAWQAFAPLVSADVPSARSKCAVAFMRPLWNCRNAPGRELTVVGERPGTLARATRNGPLSGQRQQASACQNARADRAGQARRSCGTV